MFERCAQFAHGLRLQLMDPRHADPEDFRDFRKIELLDEIELDDELQPLRQVGDCGDQRLARLLGL